MCDRLVQYALLSSNRFNAASAASKKLLNMVAPRYPKDSHNSYCTSPQHPIMNIPGSITYYANPLLTCPRTFTPSPNRGNYPSPQDGIRLVDVDHLYSTYAEIPLGGSLRDSIYPLNNLGGSARNFTYPQNRHYLMDDDDLSPVDISRESFRDFVHSETYLGGSPHNILDRHCSVRTSPHNITYPRNLFVETPLTSIVRTDLMTSSTIFARDPDRNGADTTSSQHSDCSSD